MKYVIAQDEFGNVHVSVFSEMQIHAVIWEGMKKTIPRIKLYSAGFLSTLGNVSTYGESTSLKRGRGKHDVEILTDFLQDIKPRQYLSGS